VPLGRVLAPALLPRGTTEHSPCPSNVCWHLPVRMSQNCSGFTSVEKGPGESSPGADVGTVQSRRRCGHSPVPAQMWAAPVVAQMWLA
jgi:hypothetical protein